MFGRILEWLSDPSGTKKCAKRIAEKVDHLTDVIHRIEEDAKKSNRQIKEEYTKEINRERAKAEFFSMSLENIGDLIPDMIWMKWTDGKYAYANKAIKDGLLFDDCPLYKDDIQIGNNAAQFFGDSNHNFGSYCAGSDVITIQAKDKKRFIEYGMSGGKPLVLEVYKNIVVNKEGKVVATVGCGRDITENIFTMFKIARHSVDLDESIQLVNNYLNKYIYKNTRMSMSLRDFFYKYEGLYDAR